MLELPTKFLILTDDIEIKQSIKAQDALFVLWDLDQWLRSEGKYHDRYYETDEPGEHGKKTVREKLFEIMDEHGIDLDKLIV